MGSLFVQKPRMAFTLSILLVIAGLVSLSHIPTALLPDISKPKVSITASYPAANPAIMENIFLQPVEEALNGVKGMEHIQSFATSGGFARIQIIFNAGSNPDQDAINVQNRLATAMSSIPKAIQSRGITVRAMTDTQLMVISIYSPDNTLSPLQLSDYANRFLTKPLSRVEGVGNVNVSNTMTVHIALNMQKMQALNLTVDQVSQAIRDQNQSAAVGTIGQSPSPKNQAFSFTITTNSLLHSEQQVKQIIIKATPQGGTVRLSDIASVTLAPEDINTGNATLNGNPTAFINIYQQPGANALNVALGVKKTLQRLSSQLPANINTKIIVDTSNFIQVSAHEVIYTLFEAIVLVVLIVFLFLQNWRATLIPAVTIPVALIGTLTFMFIFGFSVNTISLFALVLSIGIVVDDAIIVIENVERHISTYKLSPGQATITAMKEITAPIIVTTCVLLSVFFAVAFLPGIQGKIFKQFSVVLSIAIAISALVALTLSPALCATLLTSHDKRTLWLKPVSALINRVTFHYASSVSKLLRHCRLVIGLLIIILCASFMMLKMLPGGFIPDEDQGFLSIYMQLPQTTPINKVNQISANISKIIEKQPGVKNVAIIPDSSTSGSGIYGFIQLTPWSQRTTNALKADQLILQLQSKLSLIPDTRVFIYNPPLIRDGSMGKLNLKIQSTAGQSVDALAKTASIFANKAEQLPQIGTFFNNFDTDTPAFKLVINRNKAKALGVSLEDISNSLGILSPAFVSRLHRDNQVYDIQLQASDQFRKGPENLANFYVRNDKDEMISLASFATLKQTHIASWIPHYNLYLAAALSGRPAPGYSSSEAITALQQLASQLPSGYTYSWAGQTLEQLKATRALPLLFFMAIVFIYLLLVALYESWLLPFSVLIIIPIALSGACAALLFMGMENNLYAQIGMLLLIGMTAKSTILMTEFAIKARGAGKNILDAAHAACKLRFRPVIMTSLSFTLGVVPLLFASGPGANSRFYLGVTITAGMVAATIIGILSAPTAYLVIQRLREKLRGEKAIKLPE